MTGTMLRAERYDEAVQRGAGWIAAQQAVDGSHKGATDVMGYYTCPLALQAAGRPLEALRCLSFVKKNFLTAEGEPILPSGMEGMAPYAPSWLARAAHQWGRVDISNTLMNFILKFQDKNTGGFFATRAEQERGEGIIEFDTSTVAIMACIWTGRLEAAIRGGEYLLTLDRLQPAPDDRYFFVVDSNGRLVTDPGDGAPRTFYQQKGELLQPYYKTGLYTALMTYLYRVNRRPEYLEAARRCADFALNCADDVYRTMLSHKLCWGAAELYQETGEERYRTASLELADFLTGKQRPDGRWHYVESVPKFEDQTPTANLDICAQFSTWIAKAREIL